MNTDYLYIQDVSGRLWTASEWDNSVVPNGVAVKVGDSYSVMALNDIGNYRISYDQRFEAPDMPIFSNKVDAVLDLDGYSNTLLMADFYGTSTDYAVGASMNYVFPNGEKGYLPSAGEFNVLFANLDYAEELLALCNGDSLLNGTYITSTRGINFANGQTSYWFWIKSNGWTNWAGIDGNFTVRPFSKYVINKDFLWDDNSILSVTYTGNKDGKAVFTSDTNESIDKEIDITIRTTQGNNTDSKVVRVKQVGLREEYITSDGDVYVTADDEIYGCLKQ